MNNNWYWLTLYAITVALYNFVFTLIVLGVTLLVLYLVNSEITGFRNFFILSYCMGYVLIFVMNLDVLNEYLKENDKCQKR